LINTKANAKNTKKVNLYELKKKEVTVENCISVTIMGHEGEGREGREGGRRKKKKINKQ
jgi:hypothetical protein